MKITFYGASDDCVEVESTAFTDEFNVYDDIWSGTLKSADGALRVCVGFDYTRNGCWFVGVAPAGEDQPIPDWPISITQHPEVENSPLLTVEAPDDTTLVDVWPQRSED